MDSSLLSKKYKVRRLTKNNLDIIYDLSKDNKIYYKYHPPFITKESIIDDMEALPLGKVLTTKFKPFSNQNINYSMETLKYIMDVDKLVVDVIYDECYFEISKKLNLNEYDLIIALGEARGRKI